MWKKDKETTCLQNDIPLYKHKNAIKKTKSNKQIKVAQQ